MPYTPKAWMKQERTCDREECKKPFLPNSWNQRYCSLECKLTTVHRNFRERNPEYWANYQRKLRVARTKLAAPKPPYNPTPCQLCKKPLGRTVNRYYHPDCHKRISHVEGLDTQEIGGMVWNGHMGARS